LKPRRRAYHFCFFNVGDFSTKEESHRFALANESSETLGFTTAGDHPQIDLGLASFELASAIQMSQANTMRIDRFHEI
jgi:hypothetical protein